MRGRGGAGLFSKPKVEVIYGRPHVLSSFTLSVTITKDPIFYGVAFSFVV